MDAELATRRYCPFPRQELKPNENSEKDTRVTQGQGMKPGYTGYIPGAASLTMSPIIFSYVLILSFN